MTAQCHFQNTCSNFVDSIGSPIGINTELLQNQHKIHRDSQLIVE